VTHSLPIAEASVSRSSSFASVAPRSPPSPSALRVPAHLTSISAPDVSRIARLRWLTEVRAISIPVSTRHARRARCLTSRPLFGTVLPPDTRLTAYTLLDPHFVRSFVVFSFLSFLSTGAHSILVTYIVPFAWPRPSTESETALSPFLFACPLPQVLHSLRFPSARSHSFGNVALHRAFSDPWNAALVLSIYLYPSVFLNSHVETFCLHLNSFQTKPNKTEDTRRAPENEFVEAVENLHLRSAELEASMVEVEASQASQFKCSQFMFRQLYCKSVWTV